MTGLGRPAAILHTFELRQLTHATLRRVRSSLCGDADDAASAEGGVGAIGGRRTAAACGSAHGMALIACEIRNFCPGAVLLQNSEPLRPVSRLYHPGFGSEKRLQMSSAAGAKPVGVTCDLRMHLAEELSQAPSLVRVVH